MASIKDQVGAALDALRVIDVEDIGKQIDSIDQHIADLQERRRELVFAERLACEFRRITPPKRGMVGRPSKIAQQVLEEAGSGE